MRERDKCVNGVGVNAWIEREFAWREINGRDVVWDKRDLLCGKWSEPLGFLRSFGKDGFVAISVDEWGDRVVLVMYILRFTQGIGMHRTVSIVGDMGEKWGLAWHPKHLIIDIDIYLLELDTNSHTVPFSSPSSIGHPVRSSKAEIQYRFVNIMQTETSEALSRFYSFLRRQGIPILSFFPTDNSKLILVTRSPLCTVYRGVTESVLTRTRFSIKVLTIKKQKLFWIIASYVKSFLHTCW